jgi:hypothetical protein
MKLKATQRKARKYQSGKTVSILVDDLRVI